jgi:hypothetical protein
MLQALSPTSAPSSQAWLEQKNSHQQSGVLRLMSGCPISQREAALTGLINAFVEW